MAGMNHPQPCRVICGMFLDLMKRMLFAGCPDRGDRFPNGQAQLVAGRTRFHEIGLCAVHYRQRGQCGKAQLRQNDDRDRRVGRQRPSASG